MMTQGLIPPDLDFAQEGRTTRLRWILRALLWCLGAMFVTIIPLAFLAAGLPIGFPVVFLLAGILCLVAVLFVPIVSPLRVTASGLEVSAGRRVLKASFEQLTSATPLAFDFGGPWLELILLQSSADYGPRLWLLVAEAGTMRQFLDASRRMRRLTPSD